MRIFKNKRFAKFARNEGITDEKLIEAIRDIEAGKIDADYGGGVIKQRISRPGEGKSGGYRTIIVHRDNEKAFLVFGFAKSVFSNIDDTDVKNFKEAATILLSFTPGQIETLLKAKALTEIKPRKKAAEANNEKEKSV